MILLNNKGDKRTKLPIVNSSVDKHFTTDWRQIGYSFQHQPPLVFIPLFLLLFLALCQHFKCFAGERIPMLEIWKHKLIQRKLLYMRLTIHICECFVMFHSCAVIETKSKGYDYIKTSLSEVEPLEWACAFCQQILHISLWMLYVYSIWYSFFHQPMFVFISAVDCRRRNSR